MLKRLEIIFKETAEQMDCQLHEINGEHDHVHILITINPKHSVSNVVGKLKGKSSYFLRKEFNEEIKPFLWGNHFWSPSYCCVSVGGATLEIVKKYIDQQRTPPSKKAIVQSKLKKKIKA